MVVAQVTLEIERQTISLTVPSIGPGACEIRIRDAAGAFRVVYVAKFVSYIYVLHVFQKKSQRTSQQALRIAQDRYRSIEGR